VVADLGQRIKKQVIAISKFLSSEGAIESVGWANALSAQHD
jgi:hypothetical protein